jgi:enoyl-CoA hydratase
MRELLVEREGPALVLTLCREEVCNALLEAQAFAIEAEVLAAERDPEVRGVVLTAAGTSFFAAGGDLRELSTFSRGREGAARVLAMGEALLALSRTALPVVLAVQGAALGGGAELALLGDLLLLEEQASLSFRQARMGLSTAWGGLAQLLDRVGPAVTRELLWSSRRVEAAEARALGLAQAVVPRGASRRLAVERIEGFAQQSREVLTSSKSALRASFEARHASTRAAECSAFSELWGGPAHLRALEAFLTRPNDARPRGR